MAEGSQLLGLSQRAPALINGPHRAVARSDMRVHSREFRDWSQLAGRHRDQAAARSQPLSTTTNTHQLIHSNWGEGSGLTLPNPRPDRTSGRSAMVCTPAGAAQSAGIVLIACIAVATLAARTCSARGSGRS